MSAFPASCLRRAVDGIEKLWRASNQSPKLNVHMTIEFGTSVGLETLQRVLDNNNTFMRSITFDGCDLSIFRTQTTRNFAANRTITSLRIVAGEGWAHLIQALHTNTSLRQLIDIRIGISMNLLEGYIVDQLAMEDEFESLMELLSVNITLETLDVKRTPWQQNGKSAILQEALQRNKRRSGCFSILARQGWNFCEARAGRLFLCGAPFAGKTRLSKTMIVRKGYSGYFRALHPYWPTNLLVDTKRTTGIEVHPLPADGRVQVSIWAWEPAGSVEDSVPAKGRAANQRSTKSPSPMVGQGSQRRTLTPMDLSDGPCGPMDPSVDARSSVPPNKSTLHFSLSLVR